MITLYSQRDKRWAGIRLGTCPDETIGKSGCLITCVAMISGLMPDMVNQLAVFFNGCLMDSAKTANKLGLFYDATTSRAVKYPCIAEVKLSGRQHFIVVDENGTQYDSWTGAIASKPYKIVSYRNISTSTPPVASTNGLKSDFIKALGRRIGVKYTDADLGFQGHLANPDIDSITKGFFAEYTNQIIKVIKEKLL